MASTDPTPQEQAHVHSLRRIDHLVLAARDLGALAEFFRHLGFVVGARNRHPWGTQNHIVQFDGSFIELIGVDPAFHVAPDHDPHNFSFSGFIGSFLGAREGGAMIALTSDNAEADARAFKVTGAGDFEPFHFERRGKKPDGTAIEVAFSLAFAVGIRPCTGAILVLLFASGLGLYWAGIAATFAMAVGTFLTVSVIAAIAVYSKKLAARMMRGNSRLLDGFALGLRLAGGAAIAFLGTILFLGSLGSTNAMM